MGKKQKKVIKGSVDPSIAQALQSGEMPASEPEGQGAGSPEVIAPAAMSASVV